MEPEIQRSLPEAPQVEDAPKLILPPELPAPGVATQAIRWLRWCCIGDQGVRAGWSLALFGLFVALISIVAAFVLSPLHLAGSQNDFTPAIAFFSELILFVAMVGAAAIVARIERRRVVDYYLAGPRSVLHFFGGLVAGFLALSALVGALALGGWLRFGTVALSGAGIFKYAALWASVFLLVGCVEEGGFRCYLQFTLTRGINFWWALGIVGALTLKLALHSRGNGVLGVYAIALLGVFPCLILHKKKSARSAFWQAAWVTSTLFGLIHTSNNGENWIGIFAAGLIGFVFCVSVYVTGSAWWAIGCHAAWDWAETFFYGTADSGLVASGHYLTTNPAGNALWSGGADGPEGSVLVIGVILLLLAALLVIYGRKNESVHNGSSCSGGDSKGAESGEKSVFLG